MTSVYSSTFAARGMRVGRSQRKEINVDLAYRAELFQTDRNDSQDNQLCF